MTTDALRGCCLCGAIHYELRPPLERFVHCHCSRCRKATGTSHATNLYVPKRQFSWTAGADSMGRFDLPTARGFGTAFCRTCGSPLPHYTRDGRSVVIPAGSLDDPPMIKPIARIFWDSRASWGCGEEEPPRFAEYPEGW